MPSPEPLRLTRNTKITIVVGVVAVLVAGTVGGFFYIESLPKIVVHGFGASWIQSNKCNSGNYGITNWNWSATLINTGGGGFAEVGYYISNNQATTNSYYVPAHSQIFVVESLAINSCYYVSTSLPTYNVVVLSQRAN